MSTTDQKSTTVDVSSGDVVASDPLSVRGSRHFLFTLEADAEPDVLARVAASFNIANVAPHSASLRRDSSDLVKISVGINLSSATTADMIRRKLEQLTCMITVVLTVSRS
jgi:hypothetical protein